MPIYESGALSTIIMKYLAYNSTEMVFYLLLFKMFCNIVSPARSVVKYFKYKYFKYYSKYFTSYLYLYFKYFVG